VGEKKKNRGLKDLKRGGPPGGGGGGKGGAGKKKEGKWPEQILLQSKIREKRVCFHAEKSGPDPRKCFGKGKKGGGKKKKKSGKKKKKPAGAGEKKKKKKGGDF